MVTILHSNLYEFIGHGPFKIVFKFLLKLTKLPCSQYGLPYLSVRSMCNGAPTELRRRTLRRLLYEDCSDASCSASPDLIHTSWREKMLGTNTADAALVSAKMVLRGTLAKSCVRTWRTSCSMTSSIK
jgi:hypothetical protein